MHLCRLCRECAFIILLKFRKLNEECAARIESVQRGLKVCSEVWEYEARLGSMQGGLRVQRFGSECNSVKRVWRVCSNVGESAGILRRVQRDLEHVQRVMRSCREVKINIIKANCPCKIGSGSCYTKMHCNYWVWWFSIPAAYWQFRIY